MELKSIGTALPQLAIAHERAATLAEAYTCTTEEQRRIFHRLYRMSGIDRRASVILEQDAEGTITQSFYPVLQHAGDAGPSMAKRMQRYEQEAPKLASAAATQALLKAAAACADVTHLITVSCTGFFAPGIDFSLIRTLALAPSIARTHIGFMGCHGAINGLRTALAYAHQNSSATILLCCVELCSLHYQYGWHPEQIVANALFADGAAAVIAKPRLQRPSSFWRVADCGSFVIPGSAHAMSWRIGDHAFGMTLSPELPELIDAHLRAWLESWLAQNRLRLNDVKSWAIHPGGPRILGAVGRSLQLKDQALEVSRAVLRAHGNMSSPTILFIIEALQAGAAETPCVALAFGPGVVAEAALLL
ncbi:MAG: type III polyketide synthase [bacterium]